MAKPARDITGQQFDLLTAVRVDGKKPSGEKLWLCQCECGGTKHATVSHLLGGKIKSCGCLYHRAGKDNPSWKGYENIGNAFWGGYSRGAKARNISFDITIQEAWDLYQRQQRRCYFSGQPIEFSTNSKTSRHGTASLDRKDPSQGYTPQNCVWVHKDINRFKNNYSTDKFLKMCKLVAEHMK